jgi:hypothetical protein
MARIRVSSAENAQPSSKPSRWLRLPLFEPTGNRCLRRNQLGTERVFVGQFRQVFGREDFGRDAASGVLHDGLVLVRIEERHPPNR